MLHPPRPSRICCQAAAVQFRRDFPLRHALPYQPFDLRQHGRTERRDPGRSSPVHVAGLAIGSPQSDITFFCLGKSCPSSLADHFPLVLGDGGQDVQGQLVGIGHVDGGELDAALHQVGDEGDVARQPVELGDHQHGPPLPAQVEGRGELGSVVAFAALHFRELGDQLAGTDKAGDGGALGVEPDWPWRSVETR